MKNFLTAALCGCLLAGCSKAVDAVADRAEAAITNTTSTPAPGTAQAYVIEAGAHYSNQNALRSTELDEQRFTVRFDSSAIYSTSNPGNQFDINKLWGFSDNNGQHHQFSARFGWRWSQGALRLFGYVYNNGQLTFKELGTVAIGAEHACAIRVAQRQYYFTLNGRTDSIRRTATTPRGKGYQLYPYFGGNEPAPHRVTIWIREL